MAEGAVPLTSFVILNRPTLTCFYSGGLVAVNVAEIPGFIGPFMWVALTCSGTCRGG